MAEWIGIGRRARRCYGFDEIALVPGMVTLELAEALDLPGPDLPRLGILDADRPVDHRPPARLVPLGDVGVNRLSFCRSLARLALTDRRSC